MVGPFIFFDHMGPATLGPDNPINVRPHPHIGLSTLTWLFEGEIMHRDSLGFTQKIKAGEVNWMTAGSGIVHSERTPEDLLGQSNDLHGLQIWMALPRAYEEVEPRCQHYHRNQLPVLKELMVIPRPIPTQKKDRRLIWRAFGIYSSTERA